MIKPFESSDIYGMGIYGRGNEYVLQYLSSWLYICSDSKVLNGMRIVLIFPLTFHGCGSVHGIYAIGAGTRPGLVLFRGPTVLFRHAYNTFITM